MVQMSDTQEIIAAVVARAPEWLRRDLMSDDAISKAAAEDALSAMIADALAKKADR
jgi:hypothetical protein